jgi:hypothetical protein
MKAIVESCARELRRTKDGREYTGLKINGQWVNVIGDHRDKYKKEIDLEVKGNWGQMIVQTPNGTASKGASNGQIKWNDYAEMKRQAHKLALELEPDSTDRDTVTVTVLDRAQARAALVNTDMIAFSNGKIAMEEDQPPPEDDDRIPF